MHVGWVSDGVDFPEVVRTWRPKGLEAPSLVPEICEASADGDSVTSLGWPPRLRTARRSGA